VSESAVATSTTLPMLSTLLVMISAAVTGMTSRCSNVPWSRSRIRAAPERMMDSMVTVLMTEVTAPNQAGSSEGLKRARTARSTGIPTGAASRASHPAIS